MNELFIIISSVFGFVTLFLIPFSKVINYKTTIISNFYSFLSENLIVIFNYLLLLTFLEISLKNILVIFIISSIVSLIAFKKIFLQLINFYSYLLFIVFIVILLSIDLSYNLTLFWDAQTMWLPKTIMFFENNTISDLKKFVRPEYPYLGSLIWAFFWKLSTFEYEYLGRISYIICFCLSVFAFLELAKLKRINYYSIILLFILFIYDYWHFRGSQEILIFSFLILSAKYLYLIIIENNLKINNLIFFLLSLNLVIWTKNEGIFFSTFLFISFIGFSKYDIKQKIITIIVFMFLILFRFGIYKINDLNVGLSPDFQITEMFSILITNINLNNLALIFKHLIYSIIKFPFIFLSILIFLILILKKENLKKFNFVYVYMFLSISFIIVVYLSSTLNIKFMVETGLNRLVFESFAPILIFTLPYIKNLFKK